MAGLSPSKSPCVMFYWAQPKPKGGAGHCHVPPGQILPLGLCPGTSRCEKLLRSQQQCPKDAARLELGKGGWFLGRMSLWPGASGEEPEHPQSPQHPWLPRDPQAPQDSHQSLGFSTTPEPSSAHGSSANSGPSGTLRPLDNPRPLATPGTMDILAYSGTPRPLDAPGPLATMGPSGTPRLTAVPWHS